MTRLFVGNFDFEHILAGQNRQRLPRSLLRINRELACVWVAIAHDGDLLWTNADIDRGFFESLASEGLPAVAPVGDEKQVSRPAEVVPWGWSEDVRNWAEANGWSHEAPPAAAVRTVNSRRFSFDLEAEWGTAPQGTAVVQSLDDLSQALRRLPDSVNRWVVKAEFSMSARERILGRGRSLSEQNAAWARKRLNGGSPLFLEPWLQREREVGLQFTVPQTGDTVLEGITPLLTGRSGQYRGSRFHSDAAGERRWAEALRFARRVCMRAQQLGYFGPLGIDVVEYRDDEGQRHVRPVEDINGRHTMGRLSLGFRRLLQPGEQGTWLHLPWPAHAVGALRRGYERQFPQLPVRTRVVRTSPFVLDGAGVRHGTLVVIAPDDEQLTIAEQHIIGTTLGARDSDRTAKRLRRRGAF